MVAFSVESKPELICCGGVKAEKFFLMSFDRMRDGTRAIGRSSTPNDVFTD